MRTTSLAFALLVALAAFGQPVDVAWYFSSPTTLPNPANSEDWLYSVVATEDGGNLASGFAAVLDDNGDEDYAASLLKLDASHNVQWEKQFGSGLIFQILQTPLHYVAAGGVNGAAFFAAVSRADPNDVHTASYTATQLGIAGAKDLQVWSMQRVVLPSGQDDGYIANVSVNQTDGFRSARLLRLNADFTLRTFGGNPLGVVPFETSIPNTLPAMMRRVRPIHSRSGAVTGFLAVGAKPQHATDDDYERYMLLQRFDAAGNLVATKVYTTADFTAAGPFKNTPPASLCPQSIPSLNNGVVRAFDFAELGDGGELVVMMQANFAGVPNYTADAHDCSNQRLNAIHTYVDTTGVLVRLRQDLSIRWAKEIGRFSGVDFQTPLLLMNDGLAVVGSDATMSSTVVTARIVKTNFNGDVIWTRDVLRPGDQNDCPFAIAGEAGGGITVAGNNDLGGDDYVAISVAPHCVAAPSGLVAQYRFNDSAAFSALDSSVYKNNATVANGPKQLAGITGSALRFDGINDFLIVPPRPQNAVGAGNFTISGWIRMDPPDLDRIPRAIVDKRSVTKVFTVTGYHLAAIDGTLVLQLANGTGSQTYSNYSSGANVADGLWHFFTVAVTRQKADGIRWYIDGVPVATNNPTGRQGSLTNDAPLLIGKNAVSSNGWFRGDLDEVELFNRALTQAEVASAFAASGAGRCK